jgi:hypothetical protein
VVDALKESTSVFEFGVTGQPDPGTGLPVDESAQFQEACDTMAANGGWLRIPAGFRIYIGTRIKVPSGLRLIGDGSALCSLILYQDLAVGFGLLDFAANTTNVELIGFGIDGRTGDNVGGSLHGTTGIAYTSSGDCSDAQWTNNSSIRIKEGCTKIRVRELDISHTGGYAIFSMAQFGANISDITIERCTFTNNRPFLAGPTGNIVFGAGGGGGVLFWSDGSTAFHEHITVQDCTWLKSVSNCLWTHSYSITNRAFLNRDIRFCRNYFEDSGLDCTQAAGIDGYLETDNLAVRVGYVCMDDAGLTRTPRWNVIPVAFDTAGILLNAVRDHNEVRCGNCELYDADGAGWTTMSNSIFESSFASSDPHADATHCGPWNLLNQNWTRGIVISNSNGVTTDVGHGIIIAGNEFYYPAGGVVLAFGTKGMKIIGNLVHYPDAYYSAPIILGNIIIGGVQFHCTDSDISGNTFHISSTGASGPCVAESTTPGGGIPVTNFTATDVNRVRDNTFNSGPGAFGFYEFMKQPLSSGTTGITSIASTTAQAQGIVETHILTQGINTAAFQTQIWSNSVASVGVAPTGSQLATFTPAAAFFPAIGIGASGIVDSARNFTGHSYAIDGIGVIVNNLGQVTTSYVGISTTSYHALELTGSVGTASNNTQIVFYGGLSGWLWSVGCDLYGTGGKDFHFYSAAVGARTTIQWSTGNLGVWTGSPAFPLDVAGQINGASYSIAGSGIVDSARNFTGNSYSIDAYGTVINYQGAVSSSLLTVVGAGGAHLRTYLQSPAGYLSIIELGPAVAGRAELIGGTAGDFSVAHNGVATPFQSFASGAVNNTLCLNAGKVGIGLTNPSFALDVIGQINASTGYDIAGSGIVDSSRNFTGHSYSIDGVGVVIDNTAMVNASKIEISGTTVISAARAITGASLDVGAGSVNCGTLTVATFSPTNITAGGYITATGVIGTGTGFQISGSTVIDSTRLANFSSIEVNSGTVVDGSRNAYFAAGTFTGVITADSGVASRAGIEATGYNICNSSGSLLGFGSTINVGVFISAGVAYFYNRAVGTGVLYNQMTMMGGVIVGLA